MSCSESVGMSGVTLSDKKISFTATEVNGWKPNSGSSNDETTRTVGSYHPLTVKSDLGKPLYLHPVEQVGTYFYNDKDELVTRAGVPLSEINNQNDKGTRGTKVTSINTALGVSAVWNDGNGNSSQYFLDKKAVLSNSNNISTWHTDEDLFWATNGTLDFYAYAPYSSISNGMLSVPNDGSDDASKVLNAQTVHYVASQNDIESQPDFIVAKNTNNSFASTDAAKAVNLHFSHALTAVTFAVGKDMVPGKISKITVRGVKGEGDYNIATNTWKTDNVTADAEYTIDNLGPNGNGTITGEKDVALTNNDQTLLMIPQALGSDAEVEIVFDNDDGPKTLTASLSGTSWEAGHSIIYKLSASEVTTLSLGNIEFPTNWSSNYATGKLKSTYNGTEKIGLFVVDDQGYIRNANVQLTYNSSTKSWSLPNDVNMLFSPRFKYFAYCNPSSTNLTNLPQVGTKATNITDAASFFSDMINAWTPSSDQSSLSKLNACDLQIGMANISSTASSIDFNMTHAMGLADITLGTGLKYELSDKTYDWTTTIVSDKFEDNVPYGLSYKNYVAIVNPKTSTSFNATAKGWKGAWKNALSFQPERNGIEKQTAMREDDEKHPYTLKLGDMFYKDGAITHNEDDLQPDVVNNPAVGIVAYLSDGSSNNKWVETGTTNTGYGGHALVMGLKAIGSTGTYAEAVKNYIYNNESAAAKAYRGTPCVWKTSNSSCFNPLTSGSAIIATRTLESGSGYIQTTLLWNSGSTYPAFGLTKDYNSKNPISNKTTGWFMPTAGQWLATIYYGVGKGSGLSWDLNRYFSKNGVTTNITDPINEAMSKVGDGNYTMCAGAIVYREWTSSQYSNNRIIIVNNGAVSGQIGFFPIDNMETGWNGAATPQVRPFLAF